MINNFKHILILFSICIIFIIASCDDQNPDSFSIVFPEEGRITYQQHIQPFTRVRCAFAACHDGFTQAGGYNLSDYFNMIGSPGFVGVFNSEKAEVEGSLFLQIMDGTNPHLQNLKLILPTDNQIQGVRRWLEDGYPII